VGDPVRVVGSVAEMLDGAANRTVIDAPDGKSGNWLERVDLGGETLVVKHVSIASDWIMRITGDRVFWPFRIARGGMLDRVPAEIDHATVAMALDGEGSDGQLAILMRDVSAELIAEGDAPVSVEQHRGFLDHMAALHATFWGARDDVGLMTLAQRVGCFSPARIAPELARGEPIPVPIQVADAGWRRLPELAPDMAELVFALHDDPIPLVDAFNSTPATFLHGDWKMGNLGWHAEGRTILLDWAYPGVGPGAWELAWYLALNRARLPESKEASIATYRDALERRGIATDKWWDRQLGLCLLGIMVTFGWEKAVGDREELAWWEARVEEGRRWLT
jgi:hypothetical protein